METEYNELVLENTTLIPTDLFGESKAKKITSLDLNNDEDVDMFLNSINDADFKLNDVIGKVIDCIGFVLTETPNETINEETGELVVRKKHCMCLFDSSGKSYVTGSGACYFSFVNIVLLKGMPTREKPIKLEVIKVPASEKGHEFLKVKIAK